MPNESSPVGISSLRIFWVKRRKCYGSCRVFGIRGVGWGSLRTKKGKKPTQFTASGSLVAPTDMTKLSGGRFQISVGEISVGERENPSERLFARHLSLAHLQSPCDWLAIPKMDQREKVTKLTSAKKVGREEGGSKKEGPLQLLFSTIASYTPPPPTPPTHPLLDVCSGLRSGMFMCPQLYFLLCN